MSRQWIDELEIGQHVDIEVRVVKAEVRSTKNGDPYLDYTIADRTDTIVAKHWSPATQEHQTCSTIRFARVLGKVEEYHGKRQIKLTRSLLDIGLPDDLSDFLTCSPIPVEELRSRLDHYIASVRHSRLNALLRSIFIEDTRRAKAFMEYPAALNNHHAFRHGLLHHTLEVTDMVAAIADRQQRWGGQPLHRDLAITGALLHDIGKLDEMEEQDFSYTISGSGSLLGHIMQGSFYVLRKIVKLRNTMLFSERLEEMVLHMICSHHGQGIWGAPKPPMTAEAILVHMADKASADLYYMEDAKKLAASGQSIVKQSKLDDGFGGKGRYVYVGDMGISEDVYEEVLREDRPLDFSIPEELKLPILRIITGDQIAHSDVLTHSIPLFGKIAAGQPLEYIDDPSEQFCVETSPLCNSKGKHYLLQVSGDSMTGDGILDGDLIVVRHQDHADNGDLVVAQLRDEGATVKRLAQKGGRVFLMPSNPTHLPIPVPNILDLQIQGRVVGIARSVSNA